MFQLQMQFCVQFGLHLQQQVLQFSAINSMASHRSPLLRTQGAGNISGEGGSLMPQQSTHHCLLRQIFHQLAFLVSPLYQEMMMCLNRLNVRLVFSVSSNDGNRHLKTQKLSASACVLVFDSVTSFTDSFR
jgi:hypothetical protein